MNEVNELFDKSQFVRRILPEQGLFEKTCKNDLIKIKCLIEKSFNSMLDERCGKTKNFRDKNWESITMSGYIKGFLMEEYPGYIWLDSEGRFYFKNETNYKIYFKKLYNNLLPSNIITGHTKKLYGQYALPLEDKTPIIFLGYTEDNWNQLTGIYAVCIKDNSRLWVTNLDYLDIEDKFRFIPSSNDPQEIDLSTVIKIKKGRIIREI
jgi:hypothetical protein